jgi:hypothetical protein
MNTIKVTYKCIDGAHFFVTTDKEAAGFCVANTDLQIAFDEVSLQLNALWAFNYGKKSHFKPRVSFDAFKKMIEAQQAVANLAEEPADMTPALIQAWMADQVGQQ